MEWQSNMTLVMRLVMPLRMQELVGLSQPQAGFAATASRVIFNVGLSKIVGSDRQCVQQIRQRVVRRESVLLRLSPTKA